MSVQVCGCIGVQMYGCTRVLELRIGGIFLPETAQRWVLKCNLRAQNCWISLSEGTTQPNEVG